MIMTPELTGTAITRLNFIANEQNAMFFTALGQPLHEGFIGRVIAKLALHRLNDHGCGVAGSRLGFHDVIKLLQGKVGGLLFCPAMAISVRKGGNNYAGHHRMEAGAYFGTRGG